MTRKEIIKSCFSFIALFFVFIFFIRSFWPNISLEEPSSLFIERSVPINATFLFIYFFLFTPLFKKEVAFSFARSLIFSSVGIIATFLLGEYLLRPVINGYKPICLILTAFGAALGGLIGSYLSSFALVEKNEDINRKELVLYPYLSVSSLYIIIMSIPKL